MWTQVDYLNDGQSVNQQVLNTPLYQLAARTEFLYDRLSGLDKEQAAIILNDRDLFVDETTSYSIGNVVYRDTDGYFRKAKADMSLVDDFRAADSALALGILTRIENNKCSVLLYGALTNENSNGLVKGAIFQSGEEFRPGRYYLSSVEPGKLTANPSGPLIYVGSFYKMPNAAGESSDSVDYACIMPQYLDIAQGHVHRAYALTARPVGSVDAYGRIMGYLPLSGSLSAPRLTFGGTWTSIEPLTYDLKLDEANTWGSIKLHYTYGGSSDVHTVSIPAPGKSIDIGNGLTVSVEFPEGSSEQAFPANLPEEDRSWVMTFPDAGKGWLNHNVASEASSGDLNVLMTGTWPKNNNLLKVSFPRPSSAQSDVFEIRSSTISVRVTDGDTELFDGTVSAYVPSEVTPGLYLTVYTSAANVESATAAYDTELAVEAYDPAPDAVYEYAMGLHQDLDAHYPPVPAQAAGLFVNGLEVENSALFPVNPTYHIGHTTLYWLEDDEGKRPWPEEATGHDTVVAPAQDKSMAFYFIVGFQCASGPVTSLTPAPGAPLKVYTYGTNETAYTGDLMIDVALDMDSVDANLQGYRVPKAIKNGHLMAGPVVERIKAGNGIVVTQPAGTPAGQGTVTIGLDDGTMRNHFTEIALENAKQEKIGLFPYVSLLGWGSSNNVPSAFTMMMRVPDNLDKDKDYRLDLNMVMFGAVGYEDSRLRAAGIQLEYNILPDYTGITERSLKTGLLKPVAPRSISIPIGHSVGSGYVYTSYDPFVVTTDIARQKASDVCVALTNLPIPAEQELSGVTLKPGYMVALRISRTDLTDTQSYAAYTGPLGFLSMEWELKEA